MPAVARITSLVVAAVHLALTCMPALGNEATTKNDSANHWTQDPAERSARLRRLTLSRFVDISESAGFSSRFVYDFDQDDQGFIWIGTRNGLDRFDGYSVKNFRHDPNTADGLSSNDIRAVAATRSGIVWVGSHAAGLDRFDSTNRTAINFRKLSGDSRDIGADQVNDIVEDARGDIWVVTGSAGIAHIDQGTLKVTRFHANAEPPNRIPANEYLYLLFAQNGRIWAATKSGLIYTDDFRNGFELADFLTVEIGKSEFVTVLTEASDGSLYAQTSEGRILRFRDDGHKSWTVSDLTAFFPSFANADPTVWAGWFMDSHDRIWMPSFNLVYVYDTVVDRFTTLSIAISSVFEDRSGTIWLQGDNGIGKLDPDTLIFGDIVAEIQTRNGPEIDQVFAILETPDQAVWLADTKGVWRYDMATQRVAHYTVDSPLGPEPNDTNALYSDESGIVWAGTFFAGVNRIDPTSGETKNYPLCLTDVQHSPCNIVWALDGDDAGNLWVGTDDNLRKFHKQSDSFIAVDVPDGPARSMIASGIRALEVGRSDTLWIGTENGLVRWRRNTDDWNWIVHDPNRKESLSSNYINFLHEDNDGGLWIATQLGAHRLDTESGNIERFDTSTGLPNDDIHSLVEDKNGKIWMSTGEGLVSLDKSSNEIKVFKKDNGLPIDEFLLASGHAGRSGLLYFGGISSVVYFDPDRLTVISDPPDIALTELRIGNEIVLPDKNDPDAILGLPVNMTQAISVPYQRASLAIEFAGMHYADPTQNTYAYKLDGYDDNWTYTDSSRRIASYTNLPFGDYTLWVKAANKHGVWNEIGQSLDIRVLTPYWRSWWAYTLYSIAFITTLLLIIQLRTQALVNRAAMLETAVEERTRKIKEDELLIRNQADELEQLLKLKEKLFTNISHEFRTPLTLILGPAKRMLDSDVTEKQASSLQLIKQNGQRLLRLVDQLLDLTRLDSEQPLVRVPQPLSKIVHTIVDSFVPFAKSRGITFETEIADDIWVDGSIDAFEKILMNLLSNAFKYTPKDGHVSMRLIPQGDSRVSLAVSDSGIGIPSDQQQQIFDRFSRMDDTGENVPGAGIGLALVREIVDALGGAIDLKSAPGEGTTFTVTFDRHHGEAVLPETPQDIVLSEPSFLELENLSRSRYVTKESGNGVEQELPTVLIIEDNPDMQSYLIELLDSRYSCKAVADGESGLQTALGQIPDIVLCDVMLPKMDGFKVSQKLKSDERTSHIPIIMLTARGDHESRIHGLREKVDDYLAKPFDDEELLLRMQNILDAREVLRRKFADKLLDFRDIGKVLSARERKFLDKLNKLFGRHMSDSTFRIDQLSSEMAMSGRTLERKLKALTGYTPAQYLRTYRLNKSLEFLQDGMAVYQVAEAVGFSSPAYFTSCFKDEFGKSPTKMAGADIHGNSA